MLSQSSFSDIGRVVAIGDLHGNYVGFRKILLDMGLIDKRGHWKAQNTHLIQLGDILGRGGEPGKIFKLLRKLEEEAREFNSRVHVLLGNHEAMSMSGLLMYNTLAEFHDFAAEELVDTLEVIGGFKENLGSKSDSGSDVDWRPIRDEKHEKRLDMLGCREFKASLSPWGKVGKWLATHDSAVSINGSLFVHGGLNRLHGCQPLDDLNHQVRTALGTYSHPDTNADIMLKRDGPLWNRHYTLNPNEQKGRELAEVLDYHSCQRMIVGHTPTSCIDPTKAGQIIPLYGEKLICIDTGIGKSYGENLSALNLQDGAVSAHYI
jgi:hypothetical protein